jgi:predicted phosphodiesterase
MRTQEFLARHSNAGLPIEPLTADTLNFLSSLPLEQRFEWEGVNVYLAHANPWHDQTKYIFPNAPRAEFEKIVQTAQAQIIILGHTHSPMHIQMKHTQILNPGSIFANYGAYAQTCGVLHLPEATFDLWDIQTGKQVSLSPIRL